MGIGLRDPHIQDLLNHSPEIPWLEILTDNVIFDHGLLRERIHKLAKNYPISLHGVGLSLGGTKPLNTNYLQELKLLIDQTNAQLVSEHLCFCHHDQYYPELLPLPRVDKVVDHFANRIKQVQDFLGRQILVENVSSYIEFKDSNIAEAEFINRVAQSSGCGVLLDINNIFVSSYNHKWSAIEYIEKIDPLHVQEYHLAGHIQQGRLLIDTHSKPVTNAVWELYGQAIRLIGERPTLIEWDNDIPPLNKLLEQRAKAERYYERVI